MLVGVTAENISWSLVQRGGVKSSAVVCPLLGSILSRDEGPFANRLRVRGGEGRRPCLSAARPPIQVRKGKSTGVGTHVTGVRRRLLGRAVGFALGIACRAHALILEGPVIQGVTLCVRIHRSVQLG